MTSLYRELKNKYKIQHDDNMYSNYIVDIVSQMFKWDEKIYRAELFDRMLRDCGMAALIKTETSDYTPVFFYPVDLGGDRYADGWFKDCYCYDFIGSQYKFKDWQNNPNILVFFNTPLRNPDMFVEKYSEALTNIDHSIMNNVFFSRMHPFPIARDKKTKNRIDECLKTVNNGEFTTVLMENTLADIVDGDSVEVINITDVEKSQYIQYLSHLHDKYIGRLFFMIGLGATEAEKRAQISIPELEKNDDASIGLVLAWYQARMDAIEVAREKGHELSFDFSDVWKRRYESIVATPEVESTTEEEEQEESGEESEDDGGSGDDSDE